TRTGAPRGDAKSAVTACRWHAPAASGVYWDLPETGLSKSVTVATANTGPSSAMSPQKRKDDEVGSTYVDGGTTRAGTGQGRRGAQGAFRDDRIDQIGRLRRGERVRPGERGSGRCQDQGRPDTQGGSGARVGQGCGDPGTGRSRSGTARRGPGGTAA